MQRKPLRDVLDRLDAIRFEETFDLVVAVMDGGREPARLVASKLGLPVAELFINFRDESHRPRHEAPVLLAPVPFDVRGRSVLVVDDRSRTGKTLALAKAALSGARLVRTLAVNGKADYSLFDEPCFVFPWAPGRQPAPRPGC